MNGDRQDGGQMDLFGRVTPPRASRARPVQPAVPDAELETLASALPGDLRLGTSSWSFPGWAGLVYAREVSKGKLARDGLAAYARHPLMGCVGIDRTFYAPIGVDDFRAYADAVPDEFRFLVKGLADHTTPWTRDDTGRPTEANPLFLDPDHATEWCVNPMLEGLGDKSGPLVFQFPPLGRRVTSRPDRFAERLVQFLADLPTGPHYAVEIRDRELFGPAYLRALRETGVDHCFNVHPRMPGLREQRELVGPPANGLTVRWMLHGGLQYEEAVARYEPFHELVDPDPDTREALADLAVEALAAGQPALIVANNKAEGSAPLSVRHLAESIARRLPR